MAIRKYLLKNTFMDTVIRIVNDADATANITIDLSTDILKSNEVLTGATLDVSIRNIDWSLTSGTGVATITRNSKVIYRLANSHTFDNADTSDHEESASNIVIDMTGGTVILHLIKKAGYTSATHTEPRLP